MKAVVPLLLLAGCATAQSSGVPVTGSWGGVHVGLTLTASGGTLDYDCAHGTIGPLVPVAGGRFSAEGTHTPEHGGPVRDGEIMPTWRVRFDGRVSGDRMTLSGRVENGVLLGPFELRRGAEPRIMRCL